MEQVLEVPAMEMAAAATRASELDDLELLLRRHRARIFRVVALSLSDTDAAASITQDTFLRAYNARARFRGDCSVSTWLIQIALNLVRDHLRNRKLQFWRRTAAVDAAEVAAFLPATAASPETRLLARERVQRVRQSLTLLSPRQRSLFLLRFVEEMELAEIARATGMPLPTVKTHLHRAVVRLRANLGDLQ